MQPMKVGLLVMLAVAVDNNTPLLGKTSAGMLLGGNLAMRVCYQIARAANRHWIHQSTVLVPGSI